MTEAVQPDPVPPAPTVADEVPEPSDPLARSGSDVQEELIRLRAERDALAAQIEHRHRPHPVTQVLRRTFAALLVAVFALLLPVSTALAWTHRTVFNADRYIATVAP